MSSEKQVFKITTEGDCEGRSTRTVGFFLAFNLDQVVSYLHKKGIKPYYSFNASVVDIADVSSESCTVKCRLGTYGQVIVEKSEEEKKAALLKSALSKLTADEKIALGIRT